MKNLHSDDDLEIPIEMSFKFPVKYLTKGYEFVGCLYSFYGEVDFSVKSDFVFMEIDCKFKTICALVACVKELEFFGETK